MRRCRHWRPQKRAFLRTGPPPEACSSLKTAIFKDGATSMGGAGPIGREAGGQARVPWEMLLVGVVDTVEAETVSGGIDLHLTCGNGELNRSGAGTGGITAGLALHVTVYVNGNHTGKVFVVTAGAVKLA